MKEIGLPRDVMNRIERRWMAKFAQANQARPTATFCDDPLRSPQVRRLLFGSLKPPTGDRAIEPNSA
jgi:hypothetical protein